MQYNVASFEEYLDENRITKEYKLGLNEATNLYPIFDILHYAKKF